MGAPTYKTLEALIAAAERMIDEIDVVSLDVFDTLFVRRVDDPDLLKIPVARYVARKANTLGIDISWLEVARLRNEIERQQRERSGREYPDHEACYDDFMPEILRQVFGDRLPESFFESVADYEIRIENAVLVPRARLVEWIESLHERSKRLFLISDIYLPARYITRMVSDKGLDHYFEDVISSADSFNAKASGTGYELIRKRHGLNRDRWLHVGDNPISDGTRPLEFGIRALVIDDPGERHRKALVGKYNDYSTQRNFWKGRYLQQLMLPLEAENVEQEALYVQGYNQFGLMFGYFMQRLAERCRELKLKRLYFCSREGWLLQKCWDRFAPWYFPHGDMPETRYLYASRIALARSMIANVGMSTREVEVALLPRGNSSFTDVCRIFGLDPGVFEPYLKRHYLSIDENISQTSPGTNPKSRHKLGLLLLDTEFQRAVKESGVPYRDALVKYLESEEFFAHEEVGIIDVGWLGTIHNNLFNAVSHLDGAPRIHGFLMAATRHIDYPNTPDKYFEGLVYDRYRFEIAGSLIQYIKDIMEEICRAPHTSLLAYLPEADDKGFRLEFRPEDDDSAIAEKQQSDHYRPLQQGILDAVRAYAVAQAVTGYDSMEVRPWLNFNLHKHIAFPKTKDVLRMRISAHQDDFAGHNTGSSTDSRLPKGLWDRSATTLRLVPGLRSWEFRRHCFRMLRM